MNDTDKAIAALAHLSPSRADDYDSWLKVGIALKNAGATVDIWDQWSKGSAKYKAGVCEKKWRGFSRDSQGGINVGSLVEMAREDGGRPPTGYDGEPDADLSWDSPIQGPGSAKKHIEPPIPAVPAEIDLRYLESVEIPPPAADWEGDLVRYLEALYQPDEYVGYVTDAWHNEEIDKWLPTKGVSEKCSDLIARIRRYPDDLGAAIGDIIPHVGAWIRPNPLDGNGVKDANVTAFRYALLECDNLDLGIQLSIIRQLELPCVAILHSGKKSIHAIVKIDAEDYKQYRERVNRLYEIADRNGFDVDRQNRNPSRLSRMPGIMRDGKPQYLIGLNQGQPSWDEWIDHIAEINDDLPDIEPFSLDAIPKLADTMVECVLRVGHKLLLQGPSKAGKSFALLQLAIACAEGLKWFGWKVKKGRVLYINLELDKPSALHRMSDVYGELGIKTVTPNIDIWHLRGKSVPLDKLVPKLIRRALKRKYSLILIDPIYKVLTGDENSAEDMALFCNQFDKIANELGASVVYAHHHSKGLQGGKRSMDRSSGSGVFARDPDAILDMIELDITDARAKQLEQRMVCREIEAFMQKYGNPGWLDIGQDDMLVDTKFLPHAFSFLDDELHDDLRLNVVDAREAAKNSTGWRIEATLREFAPIKPRRIWFRYPVHHEDEWNLLTDAKAPGEETPMDIAKARKEKKIQEEKAEVTTTFAMLAGEDGFCRLKEMAEYIGVSDKTMRARVVKSKQYKIDQGVVTKL